MLWSKPSKHKDNTKYQTHKNMEINLVFAKQQSKTAFYPKYRLFLYWILSNYDFFPVYNFLVSHYENEVQQYLSDLLQQCHQMMTITWIEILTL